MPESFELPTQERTTVNFAVKDNEGNLEIIPLSTVELPRHLGQDFRWTEKIIDNNDQDITLACYLLKLPSKGTIPTNLKHPGLLLKNNKLFFLNAMVLDTLKSALIRKPPVL